MLLPMGFIHGIKIDEPFREWGGLMYSVMPTLKTKHPLAGQRNVLRYCQSEPAPTSAPTWMDGSLRGFSFLSLCHPRSTFFVCPFSHFLSPDLGFFCNFIFSPPRTWDFILFFAFETFPTHPPTTPHCPHHLLKYIFELKVESSPLPTHL